MILRERPSVFRLFFVVRGSVIGKVLPQILLSALLGAIVNHFADSILALKIGLTPIPFTLIGLALSIFIGFKNNAAYDR